MNKIKRFIYKNFFSDELSFDVRMFNFVAVLGALASLVWFVARICLRLPFLSIFVMAFLFVLFSASFVIAAKRPKNIRTITSVIMLVHIFIAWPSMFFASGGAKTGMAAYFVLLIILSYLLLKGKVRIFALVASCAVVLFCYTATLLFGLPTVPKDGLDKIPYYVNCIACIFVSGFFVNFVIYLQKRDYFRERDRAEKEKDRAELAAIEIAHGEELLKLLNKSATMLLTSEPESFAEVIHQSMRKIGECLEIDCIYIWRREERGGHDGYVLQYEWFKQENEKDSSFEAVTGSRFIPRMPEWDDRLLGEKGYMAELATVFGGFVGEKMRESGVQAVTSFPVFFQGKYWGFVTYENRHSEKLCTEREAGILGSGSLLLANAVERNENLLMLKERLQQQQLMSDISKSFISKQQLSGLINAAIGRMGTFMNIERVIIAVFEKGTDRSHPEYMWFSDEQFRPVTSQKGFSSIVKELFPHHHDNEGDSLSIFCDDPQNQDCGKFRIMSEKSGFKSFIGVPIYVGGELWGIMSIEKHTCGRRWNDNDRQLVSMVSSAIANAVARDVIEKERAAALEQAIAASSAKGDFLSNMSHEIRTPMNAIIGMTSIGKASTTAEKKDYAFDRIDNASKHLLGVINDILDMSKIEANKLELSPVSFGFEKMVQKVTNFITFRVDERGQKFYIDLDKRIPPTLLGDEQRLAQVITNLLSNAVKFTPEGGEIRLSATLLDCNSPCNKGNYSANNNGINPAAYISDSGSDSTDSNSITADLGSNTAENTENINDEDVCTIRVEVSDNGIGITPEQQARLFRSFEQAEAGTSRKYGGTGLGLAISKRIVQLMEGEIWVQSTVGKGSSFIFTARLRRGQQNQKPLLEGTNLSNLRVFAVDDEQYVRDFFMATAKDIGISCTVAESGERAIEMLRQNDEYNIFFLDWKLPGISGIDLCKHIRQNIGRRHVIIIFSSSDWRVLEDEAREAGIDKFLPKPLFRSAIIDLIGEYITADETKPQPVEEDSPDDFSGHTILLAEDVEINREILISLLSPTGVSIDCAENGAIAAQMFADNPDRYSLVFMDIQMPELDGYGATRRIRALNTPRAKSVPIIAMTANVFKEDVDRCLDAGMNAHVGKPLDLNEVLSMMRATLK